MSEQDQQREKTIYRVDKTKDYSVICNFGPRDERLSWGATGLLAYMLTMPDDWCFYETELVKHKVDTLYKVKEYMKELRSAGYVKKVPRKGENGRIQKWETVIIERPEIQENDPEVDPPDGGISTSGENVDNTPEVEIPVTGDTSRVENQTCGIRPLLNTDIKLNTDNNNIPVGEELETNVSILPDLQKAVAITFLAIGKKPKLSEDDLICLNMLFKIHTPATIQTEILKAFKRLEEKGSVKVEYNGQEYTIKEAHKLPVRYIYNSMKNWNSLRNTKGGRNNGKTGVSRGNTDRKTKNYAGKGDSAILAE